MTQLESCSFDCHVLTAKFLNFSESEENGKALILDYAFDFSSLGCKLSYSSYYESVFSEF